MKLSIEATDKLENKDFHYELTVSKTHIAMVCGTVLASLALVAWLKKTTSIVYDTPKVRQKKI